jgi:hypothetical protein
VIKADLEPVFREVWERLPAERSKAYDFFCKYRDMGPTRSLEKLHRSCTEVAPISVRQLKEYSLKYNWQKRVRAFDDSVFKMERNKAIQRIIEFNKRRAEQALAMMDQGFAQMEQEHLKTAKEKNERFKLGFDVFRSIHALDTSKVELERANEESDELTMEEEVYRLQHAMDTAWANESQEMRDKLEAMLIEYAKQFD